MRPCWPPPHRSPIQRSRPTSRTCASSSPSCARSTPTDDALARAELLLARADELGFAPLRLECSLEVATIHALLGPFEAATRELADLHAQAEASAYAAVAAQSAIELANLYGQRLAQPELALQWARRATEAARAGGDAELVDRAEGAIAGALGQAGRHDEVLHYYEALLARLATRCPDPCPGRVDIEAELSVTHDALGDRLAALEHAELAVELATESLGPDHPTTGIARSKLCIALDSAGEITRAVAECTHAHEILAGAWTERHPDTALTLATLGTTEVTAGRVDAGRAHLREAHTMLVELLGAGHPDAIGVLANLGWSYVETHDPAAGVEVVGPALRQLEAIPDVDPMSLAACHHNYATALIELGRNDEAVPSLRRAIALRSSVPGVRAEELVNNRTQLGGALWLSGHGDEAIAPLESAIYAERADDSRYNRVVRRYYLAGALSKQDAARALRVLDDALAIAGDDVELEEITLAARELRDRIRREKTPSP